MDNNTKILDVEIINTLRSLYNKPADYIVRAVRGKIVGKKAEQLQFEYRHREKQKQEEQKFLGI